jgi:hypothetical protein
MIVDMLLEDDCLQKVFYYKPVPPTARKHENVYDMALRRRWTWGAYSWDVCDEVG